MKKTTSSDESKVSVVASDDAIKGTQKIKINSLAQAMSVTSGELKTTDGSKITANTKLSDLGFTGSGKIVFHRNEDGEDYDFELNGDSTIGLLLKDFEIMGVDARLDESSGRLFINSKEAGVEHGFSMTQTDADGNVITDPDGTDLLGTLGLRELTAAEKAAGVSPTKGAGIVNASDAEIELNGAVFRSTDNVFNINGLTITAKDVTKDNEEITLNTQVDTDAIYNQIKDMLKEYSSLINELDKLYNADTAKDYEPLTDEEKDAMSETEIEKWEQKIKDSLLRRDSTISSISSAMKQSSLMSYSVNGKNMTLSDFGIGTLGYFRSADNERNALHIDGDEDDDAVSTNTNKLKQMIAEDPDAVAGFFSKFMQELGERFTNLSASSNDRTYGSFYDDKKAKSDLEKYEKKISDWEEYVTEIEDKYYKQFSNMETQLAKLNNTQTSLSNYFG